MGVFKKFDNGDILYTIVHARPHVQAGIGGIVFDFGGPEFQNTFWKGSTGISGGLSLYGGIRSRYDVRSEDFETSGLSVYPLDLLDTHSIDKVVSVSGSYPATGSIRFVRCTDVPFDNFQDVTDDRWFEEHHRPIQLLYDYYSGIDSSYFLGAYDFYSTLLFSRSGSDGYLSPHFIFSNVFAFNPVHSPTGSWTALAWVKPLPYSTGSEIGRSATILGQPNNWSVGISPDEHLTLFVEGSASVSYASPLRMAEWNHIAVSVSGGVSASFFVDGRLTEVLPVQANNSNNTFTQLNVGIGQSGSVQMGGFNGYLFETQVWKTSLDDDAISSIFETTLLGSSSLDLIHYARYNDGPLGTSHGYSAGSGAFDYSPYGVLGTHGTLGFYLNGYKPVWQPNDHPTFVPKLSVVYSGSEDLKLFHVPSLFYGRQIDPGTVVVKDGSFNRKGVVRVFNDDGRGSLYVSGSYTRSISGEEYEGQRRRKVGNVFYTEGLVVFTDPALWDLANTGSHAVNILDTDPSIHLWGPEVESSGVFHDVISLEFKGQNTVYTKTFNCRIDTTEFNSSNNPSFYTIDENGVKRSVRDDGTTYITAVGLYNEDRQLVGVAKLAHPLRNREKDKLNVRIRYDF